MANYINYLIRSVVPLHLQEDVRLNQSIKIYFTEPLDEETVNDANFWVMKASTVERVPGTILYYANNTGFYIQFIPTANWEANTTYRVTVRGESKIVENIDEVVDGIRSLDGQGIIGDYYWTFTTGEATYLNKAVLVYPSNKISYIGGTPEFSWNAVSEAVEYEIEISTSPSFETIVYNTTTSTVTIAITLQLNDKQEYWWRVRAIDYLGNVAEWSDIWSFYNGDLNQGRITREDSLTEYPLVNFYGEQNATRKVLKTMPVDGALNINMNMNCFAVEIDGYIDPATINNDTVALVGIPISSELNVLDGQQWWYSPPINVSQSVVWNPTNLTADMLRNIVPHGRVNMELTSIYDPIGKKTTILGTFVTPIDVIQDSIYTPQRASYTYMRESLVGDADGENMVFYIPGQPLEDSVQIFGDGELVSDYSIANNEITFNVPPATGVSLEAIFLSSYTIVEPLYGLQNRVNTVFYISQDPAPDTLYINKNGCDLIQNVEYTISGRMITLVEAPYGPPLSSDDPNYPDPDKIYARYKIASPYIVSLTLTGIIDGDNNIFALDYTPYKNTEQIYLNGKLIRREEYSIAGNIVTFNEAPAIGSILNAVGCLTYPMITNDAPIGATNGINRTFSIAGIPQSGTLAVFKNGVLLDKDSYTYTNNIINIVTPPETGSYLRCNYYTSGKPQFTMPQSVGLTFLYPNNRYVLTINMDNLKYIGWFTSQYWPMFATLNDVKIESGYLEVINDHNLYYKIRENSIEAIFLQTGPLNYNVKSAMETHGFIQTMLFGPAFPQAMVFGPMLIHTTYYDPRVPVNMKFDPNSPMYPLFMYTKLSSAYDLLFGEITKTSLTAGGEKTLGDFTIKRSNIPAGNAKLILDDLYKQMKIYYDLLLGHSKRGQMNSAWTVKGIYNYNQYNSDYPVASRLHTSRRIHEYPKWPMFIWGKWGRSI